MATPVFQQMRILIQTGLRLDWATKDRWLGPILFAVTMLLGFSFALGTPNSEQVVLFFIAEAILTVFFALQLNFVRFLEPLTQDRVFTLMRTYPLQPAVWYLSQYVLLLVSGLLVLLPTLGAAMFFHQEAPISLWKPQFIGLCVLALAGLAAIGLLLSVLTLNSNAKQLLFPILYFPLTIPVLLASVEASKVMFGVSQATSTEQSPWLVLLIVFDILYISLGTLLFGEVVNAD